jgi:site-specific recombinase XerC
VFARKLGMPLGRRGVWEIVKRAVRACRLRNNLTVHSLRHTFVTALASQPGADPLAVMRLARVRDMATVLTYFHLAKGDRQRLVEGLGLVSHPKTKVLAAGRRAGERRAQAIEHETAHRDVGHGPNVGRSPDRA